VSVRARAGRPIAATGGRCCNAAGHGGAPGAPARRGRSALVGRQQRCSQVRQFFRAEGRETCLSWRLWRPQLGAGGDAVCACGAVTGPAPGRPAATRRYRRAARERSAALRLRPRREAARAAGRHGRRAPPCLAGAGLRAVAVACACSHLSALVCAPRAWAWLARRRLTAPARTRKPRPPTPRLHGRRTLPARRRRRHRRRRPACGPPARWTRRRWCRRRPRQTACSREATRGTSALAASCSRRRPASWPPPSARSARPRCARPTPHGRGPARPPVAGARARFPACAKRRVCSHIAPPAARLSLAHVRPRGGGSAAPRARVLTGPGALRAGACGVPSPLL